MELGEGGTVELLRNSSRALGEGAEMAQVAAAAMANLPALAAQVLDAVDGSSSEDEGAAATKAQAQQQLGGGGLALPSAAAVLAAAATALGGAAAAAGPAAEGEGAGSTVPAELQRLLEDEIEAMSCLMDGRWVGGWWVGPAGGGPADTSALLPTLLLSLTRPLPSQRAGLAPGAALPGKSAGGG